MKKNRTAQATIEFTFAMVMIALLIFGLIKVFRWIGMDYAQRGWERQNSTVFVGWSANIDEGDRTKRMGAYTHNF